MSSLEIKSGKMIWLQLTVLYLLVLLMFMI